MSDESINLPMASATGVGRFVSRLSTLAREDNTTPLARSVTQRGRRAERRKRNQEAFWGQRAVAAAVSPQAEASYEWDRMRAELVAASRLPEAPAQDELWAMVRDSVRDLRAELAEAIAPPAEPDDEDDEDEEEVRL